MTGLKYELILGSDFFHKYNVIIDYECRKLIIGGNDIIFDRSVPQVVEESRQEILLSGLNMNECMENVEGNVSSDNDCNINKLEWKGMDLGIPPHSTLELNDVICESEYGNFVSSLLQKNINLVDNTACVASSLYEHKLEVDESLAFKAKCYPIAQAYREQVNLQIQKMIKDNIIERAVTSYPIAQAYREQAMLSITLVSFLKQAGWMQSRIFILLPVSKRSKVLLGLLNYDKKFIPNMAKICLSLYRLLKKGTKFKWSPVEELAFNEIKSYFYNNLSLIHPNFKKNILVIVDAFSKYVRFFATSRCNALTVIDCLNEYFLMVGYPKRIIMDNGKCFKNKKLLTFLCKYNISASFIPIRHPCSNIAERFIRELTQLLRILCNESHTSWFEKLFYLEDIINSTPSSTTESCPNKFLFAKTSY
ncbi:Integrase core domain [Popillia japonica]|uniref:Integrase core domain n=1 Tax=Popillia japonica TaxID=7064 RepID=A0AAW1HRQ4_POPJA